MLCVVLGVTSVAWSPHGSPSCTWSRRLNTVVFRDESGDMMQIRVVGVAHELFDKILFLCPRSSIEVPAGQAQVLSRT